MKLGLYSSKPGSTVPNLLSVQNHRLDFLPTVLCCPLKAREPETIVRRVIAWGGVDYTVLCELARPVNRRVLRPLGVLDEEQSRAVMAALLKVLAAR